MGLVQRVDRTNANAYGDIGLMRCEPAKIALRDGAQPYWIGAARRIPLPLLPKVKVGLKRMLQAGIIEKVTGPTDWYVPHGPSTEAHWKDTDMC